MADTRRDVESSGDEPYADRHTFDTEGASGAHLSDPDRGAGLAQDQVGRDLDMQHAAYGRDGGAQDRFQDAGGAFGQAGIDATTGRHASPEEVDETAETP